MAEVDLTLIGDGFHGASHLMSVGTGVLPSAGNVAALVTDFVLMGMPTTKAEAGPVFDGVEVEWQDDATE